MESVGYLLIVALTLITAVADLILVRLRILNYSMLRRAWPYMIGFDLVLGAILTTPEVLSQVMMAVPLYLSYEITVWIAWYWERRDRKRGLIL